MRFLKFQLPLLMLFLLVLALPNSVFAFPQYKVALLPTLNTANLNTTEVSKLIEYKIHRKLRFPFYEFIPATESATALKMVTTKHNLPIVDQGSLTLMSESLSADIVLIAEVIRAQSHLQNSFSLWHVSDDTIETIDVQLKLYAYSAKDDKYYIVKAQKYSSAPATANHTLQSTVDEAMDELLKQLPFETIPRSIQE